MKQYDIYWANLPAPIGRRPVLLLTRSAAIAYLNKLIVAEVTSTIRSIPQEVGLGASEGLSAPSVANLDNVHVVRKSLLGAWIGTLATPQHRDVKRTFGYTLD